MNGQSCLTRLCLVGFLLLVFSGTSMAGEIIGDAFSVTYQSPPDGALAWQITGPDGSAVQSESWTITADDPFPDGQYHYELLGRLTNKQTRVHTEKEQLNNGREGTAQPSRIPMGAIESGNFRITDGMVVSTEAIEE